MKFFLSSHVLECFWGKNFQFLPQKHPLLSSYDWAYLVQRYVQQSVIYMRIV